MTLSTRLSMPRVTIRIEEDKLNGYRKIAENDLKPLSTVIVEHLTSADYRPSTRQLYQAATDVHRKYKGFLSRDQALHITSVVLNSLHDAAKPC